MVTLKDVGELAGVTATTASAALRGKDYVKPETTQRVRDAARKLGYKINLSGRSLRSGRSDTITFLTSGLEGDYFSHLAMCVAEEVHKRDSHMLIELSRYLTDDNDLSYTFSDGIIAINAPRAVDILKRHPAVMLENYDTSLPIDTVNAPSDAGSRAAIEHLIARVAVRASASSATITIPTIPTSFPARVIFVCGPPRRRFSRPDCRLTSAVISSNPRGRLTAVSRPGAAWLRKASASTTVCTA